MLKYENSFWDNPGPGQLPRYERGPQRLYEKLTQGTAELDELLGFFRDRMSLEERYAAELRQLSERQLSLEGFDKDEGATMKTAYRGLLSECLALSEAHANVAMEIQSSLVAPLRRFTHEHRARIVASWKVVDQAIRQASGELVQVERNHRVYTQKAALAEQLRLQEGADSMQPPAERMEFEVKSRASMVTPSDHPLSVSSQAASSDRSVEAEADADVALQRQLLSGGSSAQSNQMLLPDVRGSLDVASIVLGNVALTRHEFHVMLQRMQVEVPQHDVRFGILGTFKGLISGESLAGWWCTNYPTIVRNEDDAVLVGQSLLDQGYVRFMGRGSQFQSRANAYYQWKRPALEFQSDDENDDDDDDEPLSERRGHLGQAMSYERARREADEASSIYRDSVQRAEVVRTALEEQLTNYLDTMEAWELNRLMSIKSMLKDYAQISKQPVPAELAISERLDVYEESVKPEQDIQWGIENYGTGRYLPRPVLFRPYGLSVAEFQVFGVPLEEQLLVSHKEAPLFAAKTLSLIRKSSQSMAPEDRYQIWTSRVLLHKIHELRNVVNRNAQVTLRQLRAFDLPVVARALVLYLLELPQPLCPEELHGPLRALYSSRSEKSSGDLLKGVAGLLAGLSYAHLKTMQELFKVICESMAGDEDEKRRAGFVQEMGRRLGPVVMRGREAGMGGGRVQELLVADLIEHYEDTLGAVEAERPCKPVPRPAAKLTEDVSLDKLTIGAAAAAEAAETHNALSGLPVPRNRSSDDTAKQESASPEADEQAGKRDSGASKKQASFDEDARLVDDILEEAGQETEAAAPSSSNMDYFLKDEESDGSEEESEDSEKR
ncbi:Rho-GTPase-activating protein 8 [Coemansia sp. RSA 2336]|nr:Rho-GTPase-activating protein 8 [Coemansia sp. RSA 2336]